MGRINVRKFVDNLTELYIMRNNISDKIADAEDKRGKTIYDRHSVVLRSDRYLLANLNKTIKAKEAYYDKAYSTYMDKIEKQSKIHANLSLCEETIKTLKAVANDLLSDLTISPNNTEKRIKFSETSRELIHMCDTRDKIQKKFNDLCKLNPQPLKPLFELLNEDITKTTGDMAKEQEILNAIQNTTKKNEIENHPPVFRDLLKDLKEKQDQKNQEELDQNATSFFFPFGTEEIKEEEPQPQRKRPVIDF